MTTLEAAAASMQDATAIVFLLSLVFPRVPREVLQQRFAAAAASLVGVLRAHAAESPRLARAGLGCLAALLAALDRKPWGESEPYLVLQPLLDGALDAAPKIRHAAHDGLAALLLAACAGGDPAVAPHPAALACGKFVLKHLKLAPGRDEHAVSYALNLLPLVLPHLPGEQAAAGLLRAVPLLGKGSGPLFFGALATLRSAAADPAAVQHLPAAFPGELLAALLAHAPAVTNTAQRAAWVAALADWLAALARRDASAALLQLPACAAAMLEGLAHEGAEGARAAAAALVRALGDVLAPSDPALADGPVAATVATLEGGLRYRFQPWYPLVLTVLTALYEALGAARVALLCAGSIAALAELHDTRGVSCRKELEATLGAAIRVAGPEAVLRVLPLGLVTPTPQAEFLRSWLLPVLRDHIRGAPLAYFTRELLPVAAHLLSVSEGATKQQQLLLAKTYHMLYLQVWALLPGFCTETPDLAASFRGIAKVLGTVLTQRLELREVVCQALKAAIASARESAEDTAALAVFAKNFLPTLFSSFCGHPGDKPALLSAIQAYLPLGTPETRAALVTSLFGQLQRSGGPAAAEDTAVVQTQDDLLDLMLSLSRVVPAPAEMLQVITPFLQVNISG
jgi:ribosomal RNA-processing protein 12